MDTSAAVPAHTVLSTYRREVVSYWERRRWVYLGVLTLATLLGFLPLFISGIQQHALHGLNWVVGVLLLACCFVATNACYSVVYLLEFVVMGTRLHQPFHELRTGLLILGCVLGAGLAFVTAAGLAWSLVATF